jgi:N-acetylglucosaminyldiphosphoundecaprenol N-acetyl-beta-D-mannosaminyltransferase
MIKRINDSRADFLVIAMGARKGHAWIQRNRAALRVPVVSHLGAVINFVAGTVKRAPMFLRTSGLECLWRIKEEPALWRRYWHDGRKFVVLVLTRVLPSVTRRILDAVQKPGQPPRLIVDRSNPTVRIVLSGAWREKDLRVLRDVLASVTRDVTNIELDATELGRVDAAFIGLLMLLYGHQLKIGRSLRIIGASRDTRRDFHWCCAEFLLGENIALANCDQMVTR